MYWPKAKRKNINMFIVSSQWEHLFKSFDEWTEVLISASDKTGVITEYDKSAYG